MILEKSKGMLNMADASFRLTYGGPALDAGTMDVRDLAPSLLALADLVETTSDVLYRGLIKPTVQVRASFKTASFSVDLSVAHSMVQWVLDSVTSKPIAGTATLLTIITAIHTMVQRRQEIRGRKIVQMTRSGDQSVILLEDGTHLEVEQAVAALLADSRVAEQTRKVLEPLSTEGIDSVAFGNDSEVRTIVKREELPYFDLDVPVPVVLLDEQRKMVFSLVSVTFRDENKWRLSDGNTTFFVSMEDEAFLKRIDFGEAFAKGDQLICDVHVMQQDEDGVLKTDYSVVRVLEHRHRPTQVQLSLALPPERSRDDG